MELILVRHADAVSADGYADDALRPLTSKGRQVQEAVGKALKKMGCGPDRVLCSPRVRAYQTAEIMTAAVKLGEPEEHNVLDGGYSTAELVSALAAYPESEIIMCVGHEPDMSTWAAELLEPGSKMHIAFKKSAMLGLAFEGAAKTGRATLQYFYRARDLEALL
jgi:phosphohistidine phosphatase